MSDGYIKAFPNPSLALRPVYFCSIHCSCIGNLFLFRCRRKRSDWIDKGTEWDVTLWSLTSSSYTAFNNFRKICRIYKISWRWNQSVNKRNKLLIIIHIRVGTLRIVQNWEYLLYFKREITWLFNKTSLFLLYMSNHRSTLTF